MNRGGLISRSQISISNTDSCLRDNAYIVYGNFGYTGGLIGASIIIDLQQTYELNTFKIWFYDLDDRLYTIRVYVIYNNIEKIIYQSSHGQSITTITFPDQQVKKFKILNVNGNTYNIGLNVLKVEAYFRIQKNV
ncbi:unnamed protein product (macronuclear) [Paramecium tetraurelia]|uniref:Malectin domain-containing protein n=1 Tax=Paramecium tetraurelia TaxID=5888 RepID=A0C801_PARTE|nr:uncharacterized protein GSPATT00036049001 [Paramecium tetraurelia]CAK66918.1 unnamed protein product [Paramecium tetraurelia]|eukprot:XP_001434315.1 hypothetical protein (macronuclear) [Paramecium tetraurelia strain d4-2]